MSKEIEAIGSGGGGSYIHGLAASPERILEDGTNMVNQAGELKAELDNLSANKGALLGIWHGPSARTFSDFFTKWHGKFLLFQTLLESKGQALKRSSGILWEAEEMNNNNVPDVD